MTPLEERTISEVITWRNIKTVSMANLALQKLDNFRDLVPGWYFGGGVAIPLARIQEAHRVVQALNNLDIRDTDAFPREDGGIAVTAYLDSTLFEITLEGDDSTALLIDEDEEGVVSFEVHTVDECLDQIRSYIQRT